MVQHAFVPFEEFIEKSNRVTTVNELLEIFLSTVKAHGMDRMIFCLLSDHEEIGLKAGVGHLQNYPNQWMDYYFTQGFDKIDPVVTYCFQKKGAFTWSEMAEKSKFTSSQKKCLYGGIEAGLNAGICVPVWGPHRFAGIGLASSEKKDNFDGKLDLISAYCNQFYAVFQRLHAKEQGNRPEVHLTAKEREILSWISRGKSYGDVATIVGISEHGVDFHLRSIYKKLDANERTLAVAKAIMMGLIFP